MLGKQKQRKKMDGDLQKENFGNVSPDCYCKCTLMFYTKKRVPGNMLWHEFYIRFIQFVSTRAFPASAQKKKTDGIVIDGQGRSISRLWGSKMIFAANFFKRFQ